MRKGCHTTFNGNESNQSVGSLRTDFEHLSDYNMDAEFPPKSCWIMSIDMWLDHKAERPKVWALILGKLDTLTPEGCLRKHPFL
jgi:hypothetical protein